MSIDSGRCSELSSFDGKRALLPNILYAKQGQFFGPSDMCVNAVSFFVSAAMAYKKIFDDLDELWGNISEALGRVKIYKDSQGIIDIGMK